MKLFYSPGACSLAPHIALVEAHAKFDLAKVDLANKRTEDGKDYKIINPKGAVPVLQLDNGEFLTEAAVVLQYIADQYPQAHLIAEQGSMERYRTIEWLNFIATEVHKGFGPLRKKNTPDAYKKIVAENLGERFSFLSDKLSGGHYLMGRTYSVADPYLFTILSWSNFLHVDLTHWPHLLGYIERMKGRPATLEAMRQEGILQ